MPAVLDHLVLAHPDLDQAVSTFADVTGVQPVLGGSHPGQGTMNYLVALRAPGADHAVSYLEIIGLDPAQPDVAPEHTMFGVGALGTAFRPLIHTWAVRPVDLDATLEAASSAGIDVGEVVASSRTTPSGATLSWRLTRRSPLPWAGMQPFFIDWGESMHPADNPELPALVLSSLRIEHPDPEGLQAALRVLDVDVDVSAGFVPAMIATIDTPRGTMELR